MLSKIENIIRRNNNLVCVADEVAAIAAIQDADARRCAAAAVWEKYSQDERSREVLVVAFYRL
jgi:hypothetical protein